MSKYHCVHKTDATGEPRCPEVGTGVQNVHRKEDHAEVVFANSKATEEPVGDQSISQEASAKGIQ